MKIIFFSPNAFIDLHAVPEAIVSKALAEKGHDVFHINCNGILSEYCISMNAAGIQHFDTQDKKKNICNSCKSKCKEISNEFDQKNIFIESFINDDDLNLIDNILKSVNQDNWFEFKYESIPIGKYAAYELVLNEKIKSYKLTEIQWQKYKIDLHNALKVNIAFKKIFIKYTPDRVVIYNNLYSVNSVVCAISNNFGISCYTLHAGGHHVQMYSQITIFKGRGTRRYTPYSEAWQKIKEKPLSKQEIRNVALHINELLSATSPWVYSTKSTNKTSYELLSFFKIKNNQKIALVTMSSEDEKFAGSLVDVPHQRGEPIFKTNLEWITFLVKWATERPEVKLIIRVHPREFPNKRESVLSQQSKVLKEYFVNLPKNVVVNWPDDDISLYDLFKIVDVGLNSSSTAGLEMLLFGIPVVIINENQLVPYPIELNHFGNNKKEYIEKINFALKMPWSITNVIRSFRWLSFVHNVESINICNNYSKINKNLGSKFYKLFFSKKKINKKISTEFEFNSNVTGDSAWLTYAIENDESSHICEYVSQGKYLSGLSYKNERKIINDQLNKIYSRFIKNDDIFKQKIRKYKTHLK
jgi:hypothetical protein